MSSTTHLTRGPIRVLLCLGTAVLVACGETPRQDEPQGDQVVGDSPMVDPRTICMDVKVEQIMVRDSMTLTTAQEDLAREMQELFGEQIQRPDNEVHDCQRLIGAAGLPPLGALWAFSNLFEQDFKALRPVVGIAMQGGTYPDLNIEGLASCLFIRGDSAKSGSDWEAYIVPLRTDRCTDMMDSVKIYPALNVARTRPNQPYGNLPYPVGARWEEIDGRYYIGLKCYDQWCVVGVPVKNKLPDKWSSANDAWGDEQTLSIKGSGNWKRTGLRARIKPHHRTSNLPDSIYFRTFQNVAKINFIRPFDSDSASETKYAAKFKLPVKRLSGTIWLQLRRDSTTGQWWMRYKMGSLTGSELQAVYMGKHVGKGTARWRWSENDEGVWVQCHNGCCGDG